MIAVWLNVVRPQPRGVVETDQAAAVIHHLRQVSHDAVAIGHFFWWKTVTCEYHRRNRLQSLAIGRPLRDDLGLYSGHVLGMGEAVSDEPAAGRYFVRPRRVSAGPDEN